MRGALVLVASLALGSPAWADLGDCSQPLTEGPAPSATDCLYILNVAVSLADCNPECICAPKGTLPTTATDALVCLNAAVAASPVSACPCSTGSTTTTNPTSTTFVTTTTIAATTTTLDDPCDPNPCQHDGFCSNLGGTVYDCLCSGDWAGPTCEQCGTVCNDNADYYRGRFLSCVTDTEFCDRPPVTCPEFCEGWMGCTGELYIDETYGTVNGEVECF